MISCSLGRNASGYIHFSRTGKPASKITEIDEKEANQERTFIDVQASDDDIYLD